MGVNRMLDGFTIQRKRVERERERERERDDERKAEQQVQRATCAEIGTFLTYPIR